MYVDAETLWGITAARNPRCYLAHTNLGMLLFKRGRVDEATARFQKALDIRPDFAEAHNDLGLALVQEGQVDEAIAHYEMALKTAPSLTEAHVNLGNALVQKGHFDQAIECYLKALILEPRNGKIYCNIGNALFQQGKLDEAIDALHRGLALQADFAGTHEVLSAVLLRKGQVLSSEGRTQEAIAQYRAALKSQPEFPEALNNLAWILAANADAQVRNGPEAVTLAERACQLTSSKEAVMIGTLAAAYAEAGRFAEAVTTAEKAAVLADQANQPEVAARNRQLIELYRAGKPYHEREEGRSTR
jgi:superkiller protein 3